MVLNSIFTLNKLGVHELVIHFRGNDNKINHVMKTLTYSSPEQVARDLEQLASDIRRDENLT